MVVYTPTPGFRAMNSSPHPLGGHGCGRDLNSSLPTSLHAAAPVALAQPVGSSERLGMLRSIPRVEIAPDRSSSNSVISSSVIDAMRGKLLGRLESCALAVPLIDMIVPRWLSPFFGF